MGCQPSKDQAKLIKHSQYYQNKSFDSKSKPSWRETKKTRKYSDSTDTDSPILELFKKKQASTTKQALNQSISVNKNQRFRPAKQDISNLKRNSCQFSQHLNESKKSIQTMEQSVVLEVYCDYNDQKSTIINQLNEY